MTADDQSNNSPPPGGEVSRSRLTRLVSQEALPAMTDRAKSPCYVSGCEDNDGQPSSEEPEKSERSESPMRCVSEFDTVAESGKPSASGLGAGEEGAAETTARGCHMAASCSAPSQPNPLHNARLRATHVRALRLEAELQPMRMILGRLMMHPTNKKGLFNAPVNAIALGLIDYHQIIKRPMDLGTIKSMLYSIAYQSRQQVADDIRLVFENAMTYNPPRNGVHLAAKALLDFFEELYAAVGGDKRTPTAVAARRVSFAQQQAPLPSDRARLGMGIPRTVSTSEADALSTTSSEPESASVGPMTGAAAATASVSPPSCRVQTQALAAQSVGGSPVSTTRARTPPVALLAPLEIKHQRKRRLSFAGNKKTHGHSCRTCRGRSCALCEQHCLSLEPTLLVCNGSNCAGSRIRKGATYYIASDGSRQYCQRCFASLPPVLAQSASEEDSVRYKRDLLKRKNDEELVEDWLTCNKCDAGVHRICALQSSHQGMSNDYTCPSCVEPSIPKETTTKTSVEDAPSAALYTFVTGSGCPLRMTDVADRPRGLEDENIPCSDSLPETDISKFIEAKVRDRLNSSCDLPNVDKTVTVRVISNCDRSFKVPEVVRKHFRMPTDDNCDTGTVLSPPNKVNYKSKAIALFQKHDGLDVCIFCMYVQEYDGDDDYDEEEACAKASLVKSKRVYIAYLDSVEHFRPRSMRTNVYHEVLIAYLATARMRGFETAHIWACPPSRGNSFVFWNHPASQRTPTKDRLIAWYHGALSRALDCGVLTDVQSLYEREFHGILKGNDKENEDCNVPLHPSGRLACPPLLEGDYWLEEAVRIHGLSLARHLKARSVHEDTPPECWPARGVTDPCPARQISSLLLDRLMAHKACSPFRKPVNAAALKLKDYHKIVKNPMDLGTIYTRCIHGEYDQLGDLVEDVRLVFSNAKRFNPPGHFVHIMATEMENFFFNELGAVVRKWDLTAEEGNVKSWSEFAMMSMSLDAKVKTLQPNSLVLPVEKQASVDAVGSASDNAIPSSLEAGMELEQICPVEKLISGGPVALSQRMAGEDKWMLEKKNASPAKRPSVAKKGGPKRRRSAVSAASVVDEEPASKRRRQTWLGEEVGASVRSMRTSFFACSLVPSASVSEKVQAKSRSFADYTAGYIFSEDSEVFTSSIADARAALLEFSQRQHLEFCTLRHAKYSTAVLLYYLHHPDAPGVAPVCTSCNEETVDCRWHKVLKVEELKKGPPKKKKRPSKVATCASGDVPDCAADPTADDIKKHEAEELCNACHAKHPHQDQFIPLQVSFGSAN